MSLAAALVAVALQATAAPATPTWDVHDADFTTHNVHFHSGETLPEVRIHYATIGTPHRNRAGEIDNAVMLLHGTGGTGRQFLVPQFAGELFGPGQPLDIHRYWIILPDNLGHGHSSKPSDGLKMRFPHYDYDDQVALQHQMLTDGLHVAHLRLILGTSMGCMEAFVWGETYPEFARALMPLACEPIELAGLNRVWRQLIIDGIEHDPAWNKGQYTGEPMQGLRTAESILQIAGAAPLNYQEHWPTRDAATAEIRARMDRALPTIDANDTIYQFESSRNYNPWPSLERITAPMMWVNSADDFINPRNFTYPQLAIARMPNARFRLVPETSNTHGHGTHTWAVNWKQDLIELLARSGG